MYETKKVTPWCSKVMFKKLQTQSSCVKSHLTWNEPSVCRSYICFNVLIWLGDNDVFNQPSLLSELDSLTEPPSLESLGNVNGRFEFKSISVKFPHCSQRKRQRERQGLSLSWLLGRWDNKWVCAEVAKASTATVAISGNFPNNTPIGCRAIHGAKTSTEKISLLVDNHWLI